MIILGMLIKISCKYFKQKQWMHLIEILRFLIVSSIN